MKKIIKVAIADDHHLVRQGFALILDGYEGIELIVEAENGVDLIDKIKSQVPDVVLMDLKMPIMDGFKTTAYLRKEYPQIKIIALTMYDEKKFIIETIKMGAHGYLFKNVDAQELKLAIHSVVEKDFYFNDHMTEAMYKGWANKRKTTPAIEKKDRLTEREAQVLKLICKQLTGPEIAQKLSLSPKTIENYRFKLLDKLGVRNTAGLVIYTIKNSLVNIDLKKKVRW